MTTIESERDRLVAAAVRDGKFSAARAEVWRREWARDPARTRHLLTASASEGGLVPCVPTGTELGLLEQWRRPAGVEVTVDASQPAAAARDLPEVAAEQLHAGAVDGTGWWRRPSLGVS